jgi:two-component system response regulator FlrC
LLGTSAPMRHLHDQVERVADTEAAILITGESGTGKELVARALHDRSRRRKGPFVAVNCAAISETLMESEIFGHEKGAFTGATAARRGRLELADGGTLFLDEIGELKLELQSKLLRVLQERRFERVGGTRTIEVDVRWIAATNRDLDAMIRTGRFREDLYHRLAVFPISLPPLRDRRKDILPLAETLLARISADLGRPPLRLDEDARQRIQAGAWPGNVRELANVLERTVLLANGPRVELADLPEAVRGRSPRPQRRSVDSARAASASVEEHYALPWEESRRHRHAPFEQEYFRRLLRDADGRVGLAAERAGMDPRSLYDKLRALGLRKEDYRAGV